MAAAIVPEPLWLRLLQSCGQHDPDPPTYPMLPALTAEEQADLAREIERDQRETPGHLAEREAHRLKKLNEEPDPFEAMLASSRHDEIRYERMHQKQLDPLGIPLFTEAFMDFLSPPEREAQVPLSVVMHAMVMLQSHSQRQYQVVVLESEGHSVREIAGLTGISKSSVHRSLLASHTWLQDTVRQLTGEG